MFKKLLFICCGLFGLLVSALFIATAFQRAIIPDQYCKQIYASNLRQCIPGCVWELHEPEFKGFSIEEKPLILKGEAACVGIN